MSEVLIRDGHEIEVRHIVKQLRRGDSFQARGTKARFTNRLGGGIWTPKDYFVVMPASLRSLTV